MDDQTKHSKTSRYINFDYLSLESIEKITRLHCEWMDVQTLITNC
jgi:hypothetical protein